jgi:dienelactone hydrolase
MPQPAPIKPGTVKAPVLILAGGADPMVPADQVSRFERELKNAGADVRVVTYPGAKHSFTNPAADKSGVPGLQYNAAADRESWAEMLKFLERIWRGKK